MNREDFPMLQKNYIYFDNAATTFKPKCVIDSIMDYYTNYTANSHRGDYNLSLKVDSMIEEVRENIRKFINASSNKEIIFTSGTTDGLNKIIFGYFTDYLEDGDEVLITKAEHASNTLPWFELKEKLNLKISYMKLNDNFELTLENFKNSITDKTKVISIAEITNVLGDVRDIKSIIKYCHEKNILVIIDGAQSIPHIKIDVKDLDIDFLAFSGHKMCGPTGIGVIYGKEKLLNNMKPIIFGGGMNATYGNDGYRQYSDLPYLLEAGTQNIEGIIGLGTAIKYLNNIGLAKIHNYEIDLKKYAVSKLKEIKNIVIYNENTESGIVTFNMEGIFAQDLAIYLNKYGICVRAGNHCSKILKEEIGIKNTCRASFYFYNTKSEIDKLVEVLSNKNIKNEII